MTDEEKQELERLKALEEEENPEEDPEEEPGGIEDGKVLIDKKIIDRKDRLLKEEKRKRKEAEARSANPNLSPEEVATVVKKQLADEKLQGDQQIAARKLASNDGEFDAMIEYMASAKTTGDIDVDAQIAQTHVRRKAEIAKGITTPVMPVSDPSSPILPSGVSENQARLAQRQGLNGDDLKKFGGEITL